MATHQVFIDELRLLYIAEKGPTTARELKEALRTATESITGRDDVDLLVDLRAGGGFNIETSSSIDEIIREGQVMHQSLKGQQIACVTQSNENQTLFHLMGSLFEQAETTSDETFPTLSEALAWLGRADARGHVEELRRELFASSLPESGNH